MLYSKLQLPVSVAQVMILKIPPDVHPDKVIDVLQGMFEAQKKNYAVLRYTHTGQTQDFVNGQTHEKLMVAVAHIKKRKLLQDKDFLSDLRKTFHQADFKFLIEYGHERIEA